MPDVSANGLNLATFVAGVYLLRDMPAQGLPADRNIGENILEAGTSGACPIFAAIINRINEERLEIGKKPIGFLNPALYAAPSSIFHDIVSGTNPGCGSPGFSASEGWDPVTGES